jgi:recombination protein RecA
MYERKLSVFLWLLIFFKKMGFYVYSTDEKVITLKVINIDEDTMKDNPTLKAVIKDIETQWGKGAVMFMGDSPHEKVDTISSGSIALDEALGVGGLPVGRIVEIYGPEASGKTTLTLHAIADCQRKGGVAAFIDAEHALDPIYAKNLGVDIDALLVSQPDTGEQALEIIDTLVASGAIDLVVVDSVAALTPKAEIDGEMGDMHIGLQARLMSQALRKLTGNIKRSNALVIFINQLRMKIGVMFGSPETTTGGNALKFYSTVRLDIRARKVITRGDEVVGKETQVKVVKNKMAPPFKIVTFDILYGEGISKEGEIIDIGVKKKIIEKSGSWYSYGEMRLGQGKDKVREFLKENSELALEIEQKIRDAWLAKHDQ